MRVSHLLFAIALLTAAGCHPGPVIDPGPRTSVGGTIAGIVSTDGNVPVVGRKVTAINTGSGAQFDATTGANGGYTIKVPEGTYRLEIELQAGEVVAKHPGQTRINRSDLDPRRDFVLTAKRGEPAGRPV